MRTYFTGKPCKHGHVAERYTSSRTCVACAGERSKARYTANVEKHSKRMRVWRANNKESLRAKKRAYYVANRDACVEATRRHYTANRGERIAYARFYYDVNAEKCREYARAYQKAHWPEVLARCAKRRAVKIHATPTWLTAEDQRKIVQQYEQAALFTILTGVEHHVDHIVPLQGREVCGLHCPDNLQVLPAQQNFSKSNKHYEQV